jgi:hypothetical protein
MFQNKTIKCFKNNHFLVFKINVRVRLNSLADRFVISQRPVLRGGRQELQ